METIAKDRKKRWGRGDEVREHPKETRRQTEKRESVVPGRK